MTLDASDTKYPSMDSFEVNSIRSRLLCTPRDHSIWSEYLEKDSKDLSVDESWENKIKSLGQKNEGISRYCQLVIDEQRLTAQKLLKEMHATSKITFEDKCLLEIATFYWQGDNERADGRGQEFCASQNIEDALVNACKRLKKLSSKRNITPVEWANILGDVFGFNPNETFSPEITSRQFKSESPSVSWAPFSERPGWKAILNCTQNDPNARFLLEYYLSALDGVISIPKPDFCSSEPKVSIIIPVYNMWPLLQNCLRSIALSKNSVGIEVIVADDCSNDETSELLALNPWVRHVKMESNGRFIKNCNNAARHASGDILYFLNNDTIVLDHWLDKVVATFEARENAGIVGSQVLFYDNNVQESGGIIWPDGEAWNYGRNIKPDHAFKVNYSRPVDYVSGCALAIKRDLWETLGGFGEEFCPAYCEDSDLCFKVRSVEKEVWVQPASKIIHFEGLSNSKDTSQGLKAYQKINLEKLNQKWKLSILERGVADVQNIIHASNFRLRSHRTVLVVDHYVPQPDKDAGSRTVEAFCHALVNLGYNVIFLPENFTAHQPYTSALEELGVMVLYGGYAANNFESLLRDNISCVDSILFNRPHITKRYLHTLKNIFPTAKTIYYMHDMHGLREQLELGFEMRGWGHSVTIDLENLLTTDEADIIKSVDIALTCSSKEKELLEDLYPNVETICPYALRSPIKRDRTVEGFSHPAESVELLFVGGFGHGPNRVGIEWFLDHVIPLLDDRFTVHIVGSRCPAELQRRLEACPRVLFHGSASDEELSSLLERLSISLAPLPYGAGIKGKVVEAFSHGHTVIGTEYGIEGMQDAPENIYYVCSSPEEFVRSINEVASRDPGIQDVLSHRARKYVENEFSLGRIEKKFRQILPDPVRQPDEILRLLPAHTQATLDGCTLRPSSFGLESDGWMLESNRLVFSLTDNSDELALSFYIPEGDSVDYSGAMELLVEAECGQSFKSSFVEKVSPGSNTLRIVFPHNLSPSALVLELTPSFKVVRHGSPDHRPLLFLVSGIAAGKSA